MKAVDECYIDISASHYIKGKGRPITCPCRHRGKVKVRVQLIYNFH